MKLKRIHGIILFFAILFPTVIPNTTNTNVAISSDSVSLKSSKTNFDRFPIQNTNNKMISENMASKFSTGRSVIGAQWLIDNGFNGSNIKIGIIDSGVTNSSEFSSRFVAARSFVTIANGYSIDDLSLTEYIIHGSTVANYALGTTSGIAPGAQLVSAKIFGSGTVTGNGDYRGEETTKAIVEAIYYMIEQNVSVINLSIGQYSNIVNDGRQYIIDKVSKEQNIIFVIAAGNEGYQGIDGSTIGTPGTAFQGITVGATDSLGLSMMGFSGSGLKVDYTVKPDLVAPGVGGTSFASPLVAGGVALLIQALNDNNLTVTPGAIKAALIESSNPIGDYPVWYQGAGLVNLTAAYEILIKSNNTNNIPDVVTAFPKQLPIKPLNNLFQDQKIGLNLSIISSSLVTGTTSIEGIPTEFFTFNKVQEFNQSSRLSIFFNPPVNADIKNYIGNLTINFSNGEKIKVKLEFTVKNPVLTILFDETKNGFVNEIKPSGYSANYNYLQDPWGDQAFLLGAFREFYNLMALNNISVTPFQSGIYNNLTYLAEFDLLLFAHPFTKLTNPFTDWWNDPMYGNNFILTEETLSFSTQEMTILSNYIRSGKGSILMLGSDPRFVNSTAINKFFDFFDTGMSLISPNIVKESVNVTVSTQEIFNDVSEIDYFGSMFSFQNNSLANSHYEGKFATIDYGEDQGKIIITGSSYFAENYMLNSISSSNTNNNARFILNMIQWLCLPSNKCSGEFSLLPPQTTDTGPSNTSNVGQTTSNPATSSGFSLFSIIILSSYLMLRKRVKIRKN